MMDGCMGTFLNSKKKGIKHTTLEKKDRFDKHHLGLDPQRNHLDSGPYPENRKKVMQSLGKILTVCGPTVDICRAMRNKTYINSIISDTRELKRMRPHDHEVLILDGACGTNLQEMIIPVSAWQGKDGCNELLNLTAPETIVALHKSFVDAGAMVIETNTFGASRIVLEEYGLQDQVEAINRAAVENARTAIGGKANTYIAGSIGPGTKLPSLGHISVDALAAAYVEQVRALVSAGVDILIIETCQDLLQIKTAMTTCFETLESLGADIPVMASVTIERTGTMLVGTDIAAAAVTFEPFPIFSFGLNCATGPQDMESHIRWLSRNWPKRISCVPNQGLPEVVQGKTCYSLTPERYAQEMKRFVTEYGVSVVGGCCGTTAAHIKALVETLAGVKPGVREVIA